MPPSTMTSVDTFRSETHQTLQTLASGLPRRAHIFVSSIPDVHQLWDIYHTNATAELQRPPRSRRTNSF